MKKIKSIKQLDSKKNDLRQKQYNLENEIGNNWKDLKECARPGNIIKDAFNSAVQTKTSENNGNESMLKTIFSYGLTVLAKKFSAKAGNKLMSFFNK
jgi:hypothetical protein